MHGDTANFHLPKLASRVVPSTSEPLAEQAITISTRGGLLRGLSQSHAEITLLLLCSLKGGIWWPEGRAKRLHQRRVVTGDDAVLPSHR